MSEKPQIDPYPEPVAMTAGHLRRVNQKQAEKGRDDRLRRLARRNRKRRLGRSHAGNPTSLPGSPNVPAQPSTRLVGARSFGYFYAASHFGRRPL